MTPQPTPLWEQLANRAARLMGDDVSPQLALSRARTQLELERNRELHDAHCRALAEWAAYQSAVGERLREDATPAKYDRVENPQWISGVPRG